VSSCEGSAATGFPIQHREGRRSGDACRRMQAFSLDFLKRDLGAHDADRYWAAGKPVGADVG
jgi:hypothetical protein